MQNKVENHTNRAVDVGLEKLVLGQLALPVGCKPDLAKGSVLGEDSL